MTYVYILISLVLVDSAWLVSTGSLYKQWFSTAFVVAPSILPALFFYPLYAAGIFFLVVRPAVAMKKKLIYVLATGAMLGISAYGAYDLTNQAIIHGWGWHITILDITWGTVLTAVVSVIGWKLARK